MHTPSRHRTKPDLAIIGAGAFGQFCISHLRRFFTIHLCDPRPDLEEICDRHGVQPVDPAGAARKAIVLLAIPFSQLRAVAGSIAPHLKPGTLVIDVCSIKLKSLLILEEELPPDVAIVGTHPLFGPQSGRDGIEGLPVAVCPVRGRQSRIVGHFLSRALKLNVLRTTAEHHDRQMAYVQGLTHLISRIVLAMDMPPLEHKTRTFSHLEAMVGLVGHDSDELFRMIIADNPYGGAVVQSFLAATKDVLQPFDYPSNSTAFS